MSKNLFVKRLRISLLLIVYVFIHISILNTAHVIGRNATDDPLGLQQPTTGASDLTVPACSDLTTSSADVGTSVACEPTGDPVVTDSNNDWIFSENSPLTMITRTIVILTGVTSVIMVIVSGLRYVASGGDSAATASAKKSLMYALLGLIVALFAQTIITLVLTRATL